MQNDRQLSQVCYYSRRGCTALCALMIATAFCLASVHSQNSERQNPRSPQTAINPKLPTVFVVGDSTANNHANGGLGWGDPFINYFDPSKVNVLNRARGG